MDIQVLQQNVLDRYQQYGRTLPRRQTTDPYAIHVSEVMLQQTQVDRVIPYFLQWMKNFPDYHALANASKTDLLKYRSGLGFNSRALRLQSCAQTIIHNPNHPIHHRLLNNKHGEIHIDHTEISLLRTELQQLP